MSQKSIKRFVNETCGKAPKRNSITKKTEVCHIDHIWTLDILDKRDYGPQNNRGYRYVLVIIDNLIKFGFTYPLINKNAQTITNSIKNVFYLQKKTKLIETD